jgi:hypothetical protein
VTDDPTGKPQPTPRRVLVGEAAELLGISDGAVRQRIKRDTLRSDKGEDGRLYVLLYDDPTADIDRPHDRTIDRTSELIATLREQNAYLERQVEEEREARRRADTLLARLMDRVPELEASEGGREGPETPPGPGPNTQTPADDTTQPRAPWWRRIWG